MSIYIFEVVDTGFLKVGFTTGCPWVRMGYGAWSNVHPKACCNKLGIKDMKLVGLFKGTLEHERTFQAMNQYPEHGEFWPLPLLDLILSTLGRVLERQELPARPDITDFVAYSHRHNDEKRYCCSGGQQFQCYKCDKVFARFHYLMQHRTSTHSTEGRMSCPICGTEGLIRNIMGKRHTDSATCSLSTRLSEARQRVGLGHW